MIRKLIHIYLNFADQKIEIFPESRVFVLSPIPKNEHSEMTEILQKCHDTVIWERSFKISWNAVQMTSFSKWFSHIAIHVSYFCLLRASGPSGSIELSLLLFFLFISVFTLRKLSWNRDRKIDSYVLELCRPKTRDFPSFPGFLFEAYTQKRKLGNDGNSTKTS